MYRHCHRHVRRIPPLCTICVIFATSTRIGNNLMSFVGGTGLPVVQKEEGGVDG